MWEDWLQWAFIIALFTVMIRYSLRFEQEYHEKLAYLYTYPWWRLLVILLLIVSAHASPSLTILLAAVVFFYLSDMGLLMTPLPNL